MRLYTQVGRILEVFGVKNFCNARLDRKLIPQGNFFNGTKHTRGPGRIVFSGNAVGHALGDKRTDGLPSNHGAHSAIFGNRTAKLFAITNIFYRIVHGFLGVGHTARGQLPPAQSQGAQSNALPLTFGAQEIGFGNFNISKRKLNRGGSMQPHFFFFTHNRKACRFLIHNEGRNSATKLGKNNKDIGNAAVGNKGFRTIQHIIFPIHCCRSLHS